MRIRTSSQLGSLLRDRRKELKLSQSELSHRVGGVSRQWIVGLEAGKTSPDFDTLIRLADALEIRVDVSAGDEASLSTGTPDLDEILDGLTK